MTSQSRDPYSEFGIQSDQSESDAEFDQEQQKEAEKARAKAEFAQLLEDSFKSGGKGKGGARKKVSVGDKVRGELLVVGKEGGYLGIGAQADAYIQRRDLIDELGNLKFKVGDHLDVFVTLVKGGEIQVSTQPSAKSLSNDLREAFELRQPVEGRVSEVVKGGFRVLVLGKPAFCPISQMDSSHIEGEGQDYVGKKFEFLITQITEGGRNIIVSRRRLLDEMKSLSEGAFLAEHKPGDTVSGKIKRLEAFGAFVELAPGLEGLAHISELSWSRVAHPSEAVSVGQEVLVKILKIEKVEGRNRISLSIKQASAEPWEAMPARIAEGQVVEGRVTRCAKFGAFVELSPGIEGLVPLSEMSHTKRVLRAEDVVQEGQVVAVKIKEVLREQRRISLSLKDAGEDPWALVAHKFPVGAIVTGKVERREPYGIFVTLDEGVTALLPKSKAMENPEFPFEKLKVGDSATVQVAELRLSERRISLQVPKDPEAEDWKKFSATASTSSGGFGTLADQLKRALEKKPQRK